ncbi:MULTISPECIES: hypothetical protein [unclassified Mesorhizobium]|uniref:hypothetical protein n=1 Tax=unclassified Mesorhizobium TaxID=325217 RepID=UPI000FD9A5E8|nr:MULTISPECIES: hypothetical protein [unclassified Mesorhizobium]TGR58230.1 hypothetical protein EN842_01155 [bacterium M00.F.Ca.ET.199.01.1.1]TGU41662.1 hypothetical protein EN799_03660 [bacterium M00.F.Ca.ET.156.01.1.1]TGV89714.1 hypothetical protein EN792_006025 [Mesorhizobium sp. M00.F.Ca.ET.149.01.1.1]TGR32972.1 hypothetical protein EN840_01155 [Mesorhizobium sp. M8A.F.Ca.ET.197.01.1.1]TGR34618.1 hypothetical protein EN845_01155 [Mesorhizobium sp. M8A.F.Ca.ET.202.01.1.1]
MWLVLKANESDQYNWLKMFKPPFDPHVELMSHDSGDQLLVLKTKELDDLSTLKDTYNVGEGIVRTLNGVVAAIMEKSAVEPDGAAEMRGGKLIRHMMMRTETAHFSFGGPSAEFNVIVRNKEGNVVVPPPAPTAAQSRYAASRKNELLTHALNYCAGEPGWFDLYKAMECLEQAGFAKKGQMTRFSRTANWFHRHHDTKNPPPPNPMDLWEARRLLRGRINQALDELATRSTD